MDPQAWVKAFVCGMMVIMAGRGRVAPFLITSPFGILSPVQARIGRDKFAAVTIMTLLMIAVLIEDQDAVV